MTSVLTRMRQSSAQVPDTSPTGRRVALTLAAGVLVWVALVAPESSSLLTPRALVRLPIEGLALASLALVLRPALRRWVLAPVGVALSLLLLVRILDLVFTTVYGRNFDLLNDVGYAGSGLDLLGTTTGPAVAVAAALVGAILVLGLLVALPWSLCRLARLLDRHRSVSARGAGVLTVAWGLLAAYGVAIAPGLPLASWSTVALTSQQIHSTVVDLQDRAEFARVAAVDPFGDVPSAQLLGGLRGKDVVILFVESYGKVAVDRSSVVAATLARATAQLRDEGFATKSAWLTSATFGGISWLAHATLQSGLWVDTQQRYNQLMTTGRLTLSRAFARGGWRTVAVVPANRSDWPEGRSYYGYDKIYDSRTLGYAGPAFGYAPMPDQYTLAAFDRLELARPGHRPVMAEVDLVSSHAPWAPLPRLVDWPSIGDGAVYGPMVGEATPRETVWRTEAGVRAAYGQSVAYSIESVLSFLRNTGDDNLVVLVLGDHQPAPIVSGDRASHAVPVSLISRDPDVADRISTWGWDDGLTPQPDAPVWPMDQFRDRFLAAYGSAS